MKDAPKSRRELKEQDATGKNTLQGTELPAATSPKSGPLHRERQTIINSCAKPSQWIVGWKAQVEECVRPALG